MIRVLKYTFLAIKKSSEQVFRVVFALEFDFRIDSAFKNLYVAQRLDFSNNAEIGGERAKIGENRKKWHVKWDYSPIVF